MVMVNSGDTGITGDTQAWRFLVTISNTIGLMAVPMQHWPHCREAVSLSSVAQSLSLQAFQGSTTAAAVNSSAVSLFSSL